MVRSFQDNVIWAALGGFGKVKLGTGGTVVVRSFQDNVIWRDGVGDVRPVGTGPEKKFLPFDQQGFIGLTYCAGMDLTDTEFPTFGLPIFPFPEETIDCSVAAPTLPQGEPALPTCNQRPTDISLSNDTVAEDAGIGAVIGTLSADDPDPNETFTFSVESDPDGKFAIGGAGGDELQVDAALNFENSKTHDVTVRVTDSGGRTFDEDFVIFVDDVHEAPTDIVISNSMVLENAVPGDVIGILSAIDEDSGATATFQEIGDPDNKFAIGGAGGDELRLDGLIDFETKTSHQVTVRATDNDGLTFDKTLTISLIDHNERPTANPDGFGTAGNTLLHVEPTGTVGSPPNGTAAATAVRGVLGNDTDPDAGAVLSVVPFSGTANTDKGGDVTMFADGSFSYVPPVGAKAPIGDPDTFEYTMTDGNFIETGTVTIVVADVIWYVDNSATSGGDGRSTSS